MKLLQRFRALLQRRKFDSEMAEELRLHLEQRTQENIAGGMTADEARYAALRKFGGVEQVKEHARDQRSFVWLEQIAQDGRYALRQFGRAKGFTAVVVLTLALGIGAITAIYSVVDGIFFNPVPGEYPERIVQIGQFIQITNQPTPSYAGLSPPAQMALESNRDYVEDFTWCDGIQLERRGDDFSTTAFGTKVPVNFFQFFSAHPWLGRTFAPDEAVTIERSVPVKDTSIVISYRWWKSEFAGDPNVLGRIVEMGGRRFTIVGVMPEYFQFPSGQFWMPTLPSRPDGFSMGSLNLKFFVRLKAGITLEQTQVMMDSLGQRLLQDYPDNDRSYGEYWRRMNAGLRFWVRPLRESLTNPTYVPSRAYQEMRQTLFGFLAAIGFVLAIVCANVANLTLARTEQRSHELAIRAALGAGRRRLTVQLLTENLLLAIGGGLAGLAVTAWAIRVLAAFNNSPQIRPIEVDGRVLAVALTASLLTGLVFGLVPAWTAGRTRLDGALKQGGGMLTTGAIGRRYRKMLVVVEVALAIVLLTGAGLMVRSVMQVLRVDPGFDPANLIEVNLGLLSGGNRRTPEIRNALVARVQERFAALPGVSAVGVFKNGYREEKVVTDGRVEPRLLTPVHTGLESSDYFRALRIPLLAGRLLGREDLGENVRTVVVNETLAQLCWPGERAVGKKMQLLERPNAPTYEVVGVVGNARMSRLDEAERPLFYRPFAEAGLTGASDSLFVRTQRDPVGLVPDIRRELKTESGLMREPYIRIVQQAFYDATAGQRTFRNYLTVFAGAGLFLAALGIYGVLAYSVERRTREIGIRMAIGAERRHVVKMVMGEGARLIGAGMLVGLVAAFWLTKLLEKQLFGVSPSDPTVLGAVVAVLAAVALIACWLPARRAAKVDPMVALRCE